MDRHASSAELKAKAKGQMLGKYGTLVPAFLVVDLEYGEKTENHGK